MLTYKQYQEDHEGKLPSLLNGIISKSISNLNEQDKQLLFPGMADDMEKEFQQTKRGQEIQRVFKDVQDGVAKEIDRLIKNLKDHLHTVVHPASVAYGQSFDTGIGGTTEDPGRLRQAMKSTYKDLGQPDMGPSSGRRAAKIQRRGTVPTAENYQITLKQYNEFKRTLDSLDEIFLIEVGPIDWAKSKIGDGLEKVSPGVKGKLKSWWQNLWHGSRNPLNPQNLQKWDVALDDILDTFSTQLQGRVKGIISQQFDPSKGLISKHIQSLAKPYHKDTGSSPAKPATSPSHAPEAASEHPPEDSEEEAPNAPNAQKKPVHGTGTARMGSKPSKRHILTPGGKLRKWFKNDIIPNFKTDEGIDLDGLKAKLEKEGYDSDVIKRAIELAGHKPKPKPEKKWDVMDLIDASSDEEPKLQAPTISGDPEKNAAGRVDRVTGKLPKNSNLSREDVKDLLDDGMSEEDIINWVEKHNDHHGMSEHDQIYQSSEKEYVATKKVIKSLEEYLREAEGKVSEQADLARSGFDPSTGKPSSPSSPPINDDQAAQKLLSLMDEHGGVEWRHMTFTDLETGDKIENPESIMDADLKTWSDDIVKVWKRQKKITKLSEKDVENMAWFHLDDMGFSVPAEHDPEKYDWFSKRHKEKSLDQIQKIE